MDKDLEHLLLLSIFYYIFAGLSALGSCCGLFYIGMGVMMTSDPKFFHPPNGQPPPPEFVKWMFPIMGGSLFCLSWVMAVALFLVARGLNKRKWHIFCLVVAGFICMSVPLGTTLGVFTFIVLLRPSVKELFAAPPAV